MSTFTRLLPLLLLLILLTILAFVAYAIYTIASDVKTQTEKRMEKKNVVLTKDGMRVGVKEVGREGYVDRTQRCVRLFLWVLSFGSGEGMEGFMGKEGEEANEITVSCAVNGKKTR
ncbi:MAG: hypothetical protein Q9204_000923 [Flavoplaca sp. TL-2023a]